VRDPAALVERVSLERFLELEFVGVSIDPRIHPEESLKSRTPSTAATAWIQAHAAALVKKAVS
jgi:hypothetical protein